MSRKRRDEDDLDEALQNLDQADKELTVMLKKVKRYSDYAEEISWEELNQTEEDFDKALNARDQAQENVDSIRGEIKKDTDGEGSEDHNEKSSFQAFETGEDDDDEDALIDNEAILLTESSKKRLNNTPVKDEMVGFSPRSITKTGRNKNVIPTQDIRRYYDRRGRRKPSAIDFYAQEIEDEARRNIKSDEEKVRSRFSGAVNNLLEADIYFEHTIDDVIEKIKRGEVTERELEHEGSDLSEAIKERERIEEEYLKAIREMYSQSYIELKTKFEEQTEKLHREREAQFSDALDRVRKAVEMFGTRPSRVVAPSPVKPDSLNKRDVEIFAEATKNMEIADKNFENEVNISIRKMEQGEVTALHLEEKDSDLSKYAFERHLAEYYFLKASDKLPSRMPDRLAEDREIFKRKRNEEFSNALDRIRKLDGKLDQKAKRSENISEHKFLEAEKDLEKADGDFDKIIVKLVMKLEQGKTSIEELEQKDSELAEAVDELEQAEQNFMKASREFSTKTQSEFDEKALTFEKSRRKEYLSALGRLQQAARRR